MAAALQRQRKRRPGQDDDLPPWKRLKLPSKNSAVLVDLSEFDDIDAHFVFGVAPPPETCDVATASTSVLPVSSSGTAVDHVVGPLAVPSGGSNNPFLEPAPHDDSALTDDCPLPPGGPTPEALVLRTASSSSSAPTTGNVLRPPPTEANPNPAGTKQFPAPVTELVGKKVRFLQKRYGFLQGQVTTLLWNGKQTKIRVSNLSGNRGGGTVLSPSDFGTVLELLPADEIGRAAPTGGQTKSVWQTKSVCGGAAAAKAGVAAAGGGPSAEGGSINSSTSERREHFLELERQRQRQRQKGVETGMRKAAPPGPQVEAAPVYGAAAHGGAPKSEVAAAPLAATGQQAPLAQVAPGPAPLPAPKILPRIQQPPLPVPNLFDRGQCEGRRVRFLVTKYGFQAGQETVLRWHEKGGRARVEKDGAHGGGKIFTAPGRRPDKINGTPLGAFVPAKSCP